MNTIQYYSKNGITIPRLCDTLNLSVTLELKNYNYQLNQNIFSKLLTLPKKNITEKISVNCQGESERAERISPTSEI